MKTISKMTAALGFFLALGTAHAAESMRVQCQSKELGIIDIKLSNPTQDSLGSIHYEITLDRLDHQGRLLETRRAPDQNGKTEDWFFARQYRNESFISFDFPSTHVDWSKHPNECWVNSAFAGGAIEFDAKTGKLARSGRQVYYKLQELNPAAVYDWVDHGGPFRILVPFVNGKECDTASTFKKLNNDLVCQRTN